MTNSSGSVTSTAATLIVGPPPTVALDRTSLNFGAASTGAAFTSRTSAQAVRLTQSGAGTVTWTATSSAPWLLVSPASGSGSATLSISTQFVFGLSPSQTGNVTLTFSGAGNTAGPIAVTLSVSTSGTTSAPTGAFDTPSDGLTGVTGSIAVTGWAMDDVEVTRVRILRDPVAGEAAGTLVPIGDAVLVDGARTDVQALFPTSPRNTRAGWGYLMLTNFLPNLGNGTFRLHAIADDADGNSTPLGTKTITCDNANATAPFGAIDTPIQGGTVSGNVTNFGWVLARNPRRADPPGGGTVRVVVNGAFLPQVPSGWNSRADLTALFPAAQYPGIGTALGVAAFDSTSLANGVHTISWVVTDNLGAASGIGSRYFTVSNGASVTLDPQSFRLKAEATRNLEGNSWLPPSGGRITGRRGFNIDTPLRQLAVAGGRATVQAEELDRIEMRLDGIDDSTRREGCVYRLSSRGRRDEAVADWIGTRPGDWHVHVAAGRGIPRHLRPGVRAVVRGAGPSRGTTCGSCSIQKAATASVRRRSSIYPFRLKAEATGLPRESWWPAGRRIWMRRRIAASARSTSGRIR